MASIVSSVAFWGKNRSALKCYWETVTENQKNGYREGVPGEYMIKETEEVKVESRM